MKKFIKENWFKLLISTVIVLVCLLVIYYFFIYIPKNKNLEDLSKNQLACFQLEEKVKDNYNKEYGFVGSIISYLSSSNHYNKKLQKCFVDISYDWNTSEPVYTEEYIVDAVENQKIMKCGERIWKGVETDTCYRNGESITLSQFNSFLKEYMTE